MTECLHTKLARVYRLVTAVFNKELAVHGITVQQFVLLRYIGEHQSEVPCAVRLSRTFHIEKSTLSRNLRRLVAGGYLTMGPPRGRKGRELSLTPAGHTLLAAVLPVWRDTNERLIGAIPHKPPFFNHLADVEAAMVLAS